MTTIIEITPFGTRPYRAPRLRRKVCPLSGHRCIGPRCAIWRGRDLGCSLLEVAK